MKTYCIGDIHGNYKALKEVLEVSSFNYEEDTLISLGDIVDGYPDTFECVEELLKIKNLIIIHSNHDYWFREWILKGIHPQNWLQGGHNTCQSYCKNLSSDAQTFSLFGNERKFVTNLLPKDLPETHIKFFVERPFYHIQDNKLFVHGGFNRHYEIDNNLFNNGENVLIWDRTLWQSALGYESMIRGTKDEYQFKNVNKFEEIYIGHTTTENWDTLYPMKAANIYNLDTGAGFRGKLSMMNIDTKEVFQSQIATEYYGDFEPRKK